MKKSFLFLLVSFVTISCFISCGNKQKQIDLDSIDIEQRNQDSVLANDKERAAIFAALEDTVFGDVLYGMNKQQARGAFKDFQAKLPKPRIMNGFVFSGIEFWDLNWSNAPEEAETKDIDDLKGYSLYNTSLLWKGKLASVVWRSLDQEFQSIEEIDDQLDKLINTFEHRYGKCSERLNSASHFYFPGPDNKWYFTGAIYAKWISQNRKIEISVDGKQCPESPSRGGLFIYDIYVRFYDLNALNQMHSYIDKQLEIRDQINNEKAIQDSINEARAL